jgi:hypothetical protein
MKNLTVLYEVIKLFNTETHEVDRIRKDVEDHLKADYKVYPYEHPQLWGPFA